MVHTRLNFVAIFKIAAVYLFALFTAVACAKFDGAKPTLKKGAVANGTAAVTRDGVAGETASNNIKITRAQTTFVGDSNDRDGSNDPITIKYAWLIKVDIRHGDRDMTFEVRPNVNPIFAGLASIDHGSNGYNVYAICGNEICSKYAVMLEVLDKTTGRVVQVTQLWDNFYSGSVPLKNFTDTEYPTVTQAYEQMTGESLPYTDGE